MFKKKTNDLLNILILIMINLFIHFSRFQIHDYYLYFLTFFRDIMNDLTHFLKSDICFFEIKHFMYFNQSFILEKAIHIFFCQISLMKSLSESIIQLVVKKIKKHEKFIC